ncbi:MAG TPA: methyltransferase [Bryobacteraceae bacterium]|nr:methyltransferase [Bryobacteraceae bacterium]
MQNEHSVSTHLRLDTGEYDRIIRTYIPYYDESRAVQFDLLAASRLQSDARIVDLGGGTGSLAEAILERFPQARVLVRDIDPEMLAVAQTRLSRFADRVELDRASFADPLPAVDAVLSAFALHHIPNLADKTAVYRRIHDAIRPGGAFLNNDAAAGPFWPLLRDQWAAFMATQGFTLEQGYRNLDDWAAEDTYFSVREELEAMAAAGFEQAECAWRRGPIAIFAARR